MLMIGFWIMIFIVSFIVEATTTALVTIWAVFGSAAALTAACFGAPSIVQFVVFGLVCAVSLVFAKPFLLRMFPNKYIPTNSELDIGEHAQVIQEINNDKCSGRIRLRGVDWPAQSSDNEIISEGEMVKILGRKSNITIVSPLSPSEKE